MVITKEMLHPSATRSMTWPSARRTKNFTVEIVPGGISTHLCALVCMILLMCAEGSSESLAAQVESRGEGSRLFSGESRFSKWRCSTEDCPGCQWSACGGRASDTLFPVHVLGPAVGIPDEIPSARVV